MITGQELPKKVKQALEKRQTIVAAIKKIYAKIRAKEVSWIAELVQIDGVFFRPDGRRKLGLPDNLVVTKVRKGIPDH